MRTDYRIDAAVIGAHSGYAYRRRPTMNSTNMSAWRMRSAAEGGRSASSFVASQRLIEPLHLLQREPMVIGRQLNSRTQGSAYSYAEQNRFDCAIEII
jgi:hypothetical protein